MIDEGGASRRLQSPGDHRPPGQRPRVLGDQPLRAAPRRHDGEDLAVAERSERLKRTSLFTKIFGSEPALWAALYVLEGSTLGGQVLSKRLSSRFGDVAPVIDADPSAFPTRPGFEFYQGYGAQTGLFWRAFIAKLESLGFDDEEQRAGVEAARNLFDFFSDYLEN